ncbi:hypothetical protein SprV_0100296500 [Sparganum proliferum]
MTLGSGAKKGTSRCASGDFLKRVFCALFDDEAAIHINFKGKKTKKGLFGSQVYDVIKDVHAAWNRGALYYFNGEGVSSPEISDNQDDAEDSNDTLSSRSRCGFRHETLSSDWLANLGMC